MSSQTKQPQAAAGSLPKNLNNRRQRTFFWTNYLRNANVNHRDPAYREVLDDIAEEHVEDVNAEGEMATAHNDNRQSRVIEPRDLEIRSVLVQELWKRSNADSDIDSMRSASDSMRKWSDNLGPHEQGFAQKGLSVNSNRSSLISNQSSAFRVNPDVPSVDNSPANQSYPLPERRTNLASRLLPSQIKERPLAAPPSPPDFLEVPKFESLSALIFATTLNAVPPTTHATPGERRKSQSSPPSSFPVPLPRRAVSNSSSGAGQSTGKSIIVAGEQSEVVGGGTQRFRTKKEEDEVRRGNEVRRTGKRQDRIVEKPPTPTPSKGESLRSRTKDSGSALVYATKSSSMAPTTHATPGERRESQSKPPSSFPVSTPRSVSKSSARAVQPTGKSNIVAGEQWVVVGRGTQSSRAKKEEGEARQGNEERPSGKLQDTMSVRKKLPKAESLRSRTKDSSSSSSRDCTSPSQTEGKDQVRHSPNAPGTCANGVNSQLQARGQFPTSKLTSGKRHVLSLLILSILCLMLYKVIFTFTL